MKPSRSRCDHAVVLCNGEPPPKTLLTRLVRRADVFLAADGGANTARALGVMPDIVMGDLDSITTATRKALRSSVVFRVPRQDNTDMEKTLDLCVATGIAKVDLLGLTGGRLDMTLGNLSALWKYVGALEIAVYGGGWTAFPLRGAEEFSAATGSSVSLLPYGRCSGITLAGLQYGMSDKSLPIGHIAVSNVSVNRRFRVSCNRGNLLVIIQDEHATRTQPARRSRRMELP